MVLALDRIDPAPLGGSEFDYQFLQWLWVLIDSLNESLITIEDSINFLTAPNYTAAQIATLFASGDIGNGIIMYDTTNNEYVGMQSGSLVKFTTTAYP
jgi:hypothetical protein